MTPTVQQILKSAALLSPIDRAELIEQLFLSFDHSEEQSVDAAWRQEIEDRLDAYDAGQIDASPAEDVLGRISQR
ncbi:addiction module protein [Desulfonatronum thioautotrophicum]|uniref:addiction module protein n=1 Tax=Desulfonatronum thioautotrophicum TaxID=617001 RepID=UPI0005EB6E7C|nr:addiction module protein [Desulfonatronum thioautotrophicum]